MASAKKQALDRRAFTRVPHTARAVISGARGEVEARVVDLSVAGLQLEVCSIVDRGEFVRVRLPLSPGDETSWVDPDARVVRSEPSSKDGCSRIGLSFLGLSPAILQRLSDRVAEAPATKAASNDAPAPAAQAADQDAAAPPAKKDPPRTESASQAAQPRFRRFEEPKPTHPAPSPAANESNRTPGIAQTLARLFGRRSKPASAPPERSAAVPSSTLDGPPSRAELRDLFRSAVASVQTEDTKSRKP